MPLPTQKDVLRVLQPLLGLQTSTIATYFSWDMGTSERAATLVVAKILRQLLEQGLVEFSNKKWSITKKGMEVRDA